MKLQDAKKKLEQQLKKANAQKFDKLTKEIDALDAQLAQHDAPIDSLAVASTSCAELLTRLIGDRQSKPKLAARVDPLQRVEDACVTAPDSKYRGVENQLYRVEVHQGGKAGVATFKWSHDNGSIATRWLGASGHELQVASTRGFAAGNWVELSDDTRELQGEPGMLVKLVKVEGDVLSVDPGTPLPDVNQYPRNPKVRRWDQMQTEDIVLVEGAVRVKEKSDTLPPQPVWISLEDGIQVQFSSTPNSEYRSGDYWLIPARVATRDIEWPGDRTDPQALPPHGIEHHYAVLGHVGWDASGTIVLNPDCRCTFDLLTDVTQPL